MHGASDFINSLRSLQADLGGFVGCSSYLVGGRSDLRRSIAYIAYEAAQAIGHAAESITKHVVFGARLNFLGQITAGNRLGNPCHFLEIGDHAGEILGQLSDFVVAPDINLMVEIASCGYLASYFD